MQYSQVGVQYSKEVMGSNPDWRAFCVSVGFLGHSGFSPCLKNKHNRLLFRWPRPWLWDGFYLVKKHLPGVINGSFEYSMQEE